MFEIISQSCAEHLKQTKSKSIVRYVKITLRNYLAFAYALRCAYLNSYGRNCATLGVAFSVASTKNALLAPAVGVAFLGR